MSKFRCCAAALDFNIGRLSIILSTPNVLCHHPPRPFFPPRHRRHRHTRPGPPRRQDTPRPTCSASDAAPARAETAPHGTASEQPPRQIHSPLPAAARPPPPTPPPVFPPHLYPPASASASPPPRAPTVSPLRTDLPLSRLVQLGHDRFRRAGAGQEPAAVVSPRTVLAGQAGVGGDPAGEGVHARTRHTAVQGHRRVRDLQRGRVRGRRRPLQQQRHRHGHPRRKRRLAQRLHLAA